MSDPRSPTAWAEFRAGAVAILPAAIAVIPFGLLLGALAARKGLSALEVALMSALMFAGSSQFVAVGARSHGMGDRFDLVAVSHADGVAEVVLHDGQMVEVVADVGRQQQLIALTDDHLLGRARGLPVDVEGDLVGLHERAVARVRPIEEEVDVASSLGLVGVEGGVHGRGASRRAGAPHEIEHSRVVPGGSLRRSRGGKRQGQRRGE